MIYKLTNDYFNDFGCFEDNALPPRSYFVPFDSIESCKKTDYLNERYSSSLVDVLSGKWDFVFYDRLSKIPSVLDTDKMECDEVSVPGCWQYQGYEFPFYINTRYMFDLNKMPYVPADKGYYGKTFTLQNGEKGVEVFNSAGLYRKKFNARKQDKSVITFLGVSSALQLYVNGF